MRVRNHPLHPIVAIFPLSLLTASVALDVRALATGDLQGLEAARWALGAAAIAGVVAAVPGVVDLLRYPGPARGVPLRHGVLNGVAVALMALGWWMRGAWDGVTPFVALAISAAIVVITVVAWRIGVRLTPAR